MKEFPQPTEPGYYWARLKGEKESSRSVYNVYRDHEDGKLYVEWCTQQAELNRFSWLSEMIPYPKIDIEPHRDLAKTDLLPGEKIDFSRKVKKWVVQE